MILILNNETDTRHSTKIPLEEFDLFDIVDGVNLVERAELVVVEDLVIGKYLVLKDKFGDTRIEDSDKLPELIKTTLLRIALRTGE